MESMNRKKRAKGNLPQRQEPVQLAGVEYPDHDNVIYVNFLNRTRTF